jgi:hypothetical protein
MLVFKEVTSMVTSRVLECRVVGKEQRMLKNLIRIY